MSNITFCLMTCGELTEPDCLKAIEPFRDKIVYQEVRNVFPQIKALNQMVEQVETEYLIPLDADMVLYADAWDRIKRAVDKYHHDKTWHTILFPLFDTLTQRKILALKILRVDILKRIRFNEGATPDVEHYKRLTENGWKCIDRYISTEPIGDHVVKGKRFCYHKYRDVYMTYRVHGWEWDGGVFLGGETLLERSKKHFDYFLHKYIIDGDEDCLSCIAGMVDGLTADLENKSKSLEPGEYRVQNQFAIDEYIRWYKGETTASAAQIWL